MEIDKSHPKPTALTPGARWQSIKNCSYLSGDGDGTLVYLLILFHFSLPEFHPPFALGMALLEASKAGGKSTELGHE